LTKIKSKPRVPDHKELFIFCKEVYAMLDLVKQETELIESRFVKKKSFGTTLLQFSVEAGMVEAACSRLVKKKSFGTTLLEFAQC